MPGMFVVATVFLDVVFLSSDFRYDTPEMIL